MVAKPAAGTWRIEPRAGSSKVTSVDHALAQPEPSVLGGVRGKGHSRTLGYAYRPQAGQKVTFVEKGPHTLQVLGVATPGRCREPVRDTKCGTLRFRPGRGGAGRRQIVAVVEQDGRPRANLEIASYAAPRDLPPARPRLLRARRAGGAVIVRFQPVPGASYAAEAIVSDGRRLTFAPGRSFRIPAVGRDKSVKIAVRTVRAGEAGPAARLRVKATRRSAAVPSHAKPLRKGGRR
jgi:hypothetical protein